MQEIGPNTAPVSTLRREIENLFTTGRLSEVQVRLTEARAVFPGEAWFASAEGAIFLSAAVSEKESSGRMARNRSVQINAWLERAVAACLEARQLGAADWMTYFYLGLAHHHLEHRAEASVALANAHRLRPEEATTQRHLLEAAALSHGIDLGRKLYEGLSAGVDKTTVAFADLTRTWATVLFEAGRSEEAEALGIGYRSARLSSVPAWADRVGATIAFLGESEDIPVEDPELIGGPPVTRFKGTVHSYRPYVCTVTDAIVLAKSDMVLTADGTALNDVAADERYGRFIRFYHDQAVVRRQGERLLIDLGQYRLDELDAAIMLSGGATEHFGHWVPEFLCRLAFLIHHPDFAGLPILIDEAMPASHVDYLRLLVANEIIRMPAKTGFRCRRLVVAPTPTFFPVYWDADHTIPEHEQGPFSPRCLRFLRERVHASLPPAGRPRRRIYLSRGKRLWRHLLNDAEVAAYLRTEGFETVFPEELSFADQVRLFQDAEAIVAPSGSSLVNLIFADPSVKLLVMNQLHTFSLNAFYGPMHALGYNPAFVCGTNGDPTDKHTHFQVPIWRLREGLAQLGL